MGKNYFKKEKFNQKINQILTFILEAKKHNCLMTLKAFLRTEGKNNKNKIKLKSREIFSLISLTETIKSQWVKNQILKKLKGRVTIHNNIQIVKIQDDHLHPHIIVLLSHLQTNKKAPKKV